MRNRFDEQLAKLNQSLIEMGSLCEAVISLDAKALSEGNVALTKEVPKLDSKIDNLERDIESLCLRLLLQQQPVARDLRQISAALKMITDMERIGDQATDIADIIEMIDGRLHDHCQEISQMAQAASQMVTRSVDAFIQRDLCLAAEVIAQDDVVDRYFDKIKDGLIQMIARNPADGAFCLDLLMIAKYFERIGDHATNIAEWVEFSVLGRHPELDDPEAVEHRDSPSER